MVCDQKDSSATTFVSQKVTGGARAAKLDLTTKEQLTRLKCAMRSNCRWYIQLLKKPVINHEGTLMLKRHIVVLVSALLVVAAGCKTVLPTGDTSTLAGTLQLIQDILNRSGKTEFVNEANGRTADVVFEVSRAKGDVERCGVGYHVRSTINGMVLFDRDGKIVFGQTESLTLLNAEEYFKQSAPTADPKVTPPTYVLQVEQNEAARHDGQGEAFVFSDKAWAEALKNAMAKAMIFCATKK